tara:strand:+ start:2605 stop:4251 length:1647 start_codon:yes stop_codon:yes gene_type:complete
MASIFDLKTSTSELAMANGGLSKLDYEQQAPTRDVTGDNFAGGPIHFKWEVSDTKWYNPSRSYIRMRCALSKADGSALTKADGIAPNMALCSTLFQSMEFQINNKTVSRIGDFVAQVDALENRLTKSSSWLESVGASTNFWQDSIEVRKAEVSSDGVKSSETPEIVLTNRLALGIPAAATQAYATATGVMTMAGLGTVDLTTIFSAGDVIQLPALTGAPANSAYTIEAVSATTLTLPKAITADVAAAVFDFNKQDNGEEARRVQYFELTWKPPLSIMKIGHCLPTAKFELILNPHNESAYQKYAIESMTDKIANVSRSAVVSPANADFKFRVEDMYYYINTVNGPRADNLSYLIDLENTNCQSDNVPNVSFQQRNFDVSPSTYALTVAYQDTRAGVNSQFSPTKFASFEGTAETSDKVNVDEKLNRFFIQYAGQQFPSPDASPEFVAGKDYTTQRYVDTILNSGSYFNSGGSETIEDWASRGRYYYQVCPKDSHDKSTRVAVHQQFNGAGLPSTTLANTRVLLFSHYRTVVRVEIKNGRVVDVEEQFA